MFGSSFVSFKKINERLLFYRSKLWPNLPPLFTEIILRNQEEYWLHLILSTFQLQMAERLLVIILLFTTTLFACTSSGTGKIMTWTCFVYADRDSLDTGSLQIGSFATLKECGIAAVKILETINALERGTYECGKNCQREKLTPSFFSCEETIQADIPIDLARNLFPKDHIFKALEKLFVYKIYRSYNSEYLTYGGMVKTWLAKKAISFKIPISRNLTQFSQTQEKFAENVAFLGLVSNNVVPIISMSPLEFKIYFDSLAKENGLNLKLEKDAH